MFGEFWLLAWQEGSSYPMMVSSHAVGAAEPSDFDLNHADANAAQTPERFSTVYICSLVSLNRRQN